MNQLMPNIAIYATQESRSKLKAIFQKLFQDETLWLAQKQIAELFDKGRSTITEHSKNIFASGELNEQVVCRNFRHTTQHDVVAENIQRGQLVKNSYKFKKRGGRE